MAFNRIREKIIKKMKYLKYFENNNINPFQKEDWDEKNKRKENQDISYEYLLSNQKYTMTSNGPIF